MALIAACFPSFISIRHDIRQQAEAAVEGGHAENEDDWMKQQQLDITLLKSALGAFATIAPALLPALADVIPALTLH